MVLMSKPYKTRSVTEDSSYLSSVTLVLAFMEQMFESIAVILKVITLTDLRHKLRNHIYMGLPHERSA